MTRDRAVRRSPRPTARRWAIARPAAGLALSTMGCAGGLPLLHPARTLPPGDVRAAAGFSGNVAGGGLADAVRKAEGEAASNPTAAGPSGTDATYAKGALAVASTAPGLAPIVGARVGVGSQADAGLAYTGRSVRVDVRRSFDLSPTWALSIGAGGQAALYGRGDGGTLPAVDLGHLHGWGADVPLLVGYESVGNLYFLWAGARGGWEHVDIGDVSSVPGSPPLGAAPLALSATRFWGGGLVGAAVGFRHVHVAVELDVSYAAISGDFDGTHANVAGVTIAPSSALWWRF